MSISEDEWKELLSIIDEDLLAKLREIVVESKITNWAGMATVATLLGLVTFSAVNHDEQHACVEMGKITSFSHAMMHAYFQQQRDMGKLQ